MKKFIYKICFIIILVLIFNVSKTVYCSSYEYVLNSYDINISVNENNTLKITEKIGAYFKVNKHGIFRKIPLRNKVVRLDGTTSYNRAKITDITVSDNYTLSNDSGYKVIKIGDADYTLTGQKDYSISYLYDLGKDTGKNYDELYFNLIGDEWDTSINNITFSITMPKDFDKSKLGFSSGITGSTNSSNVVYKVNGNVITGSLIGELESGEALTVRLELPEGYFINTNSNFDFMSILVIILPILFTLISIGMWHKFGRDDKVIETVEFYPPDGFNSAEIGYLYKGYADKVDVISLLVYLANKGYIKIVETEEKSLIFKTKGFKIIKLKEYDGNNENEKLFLERLFTVQSDVEFTELFEYIKNPQKIMEQTDRTVIEVTEKDLYNKFYITIDEIVNNMNRKENKHKIFEKSSLGKGFFVILMILATFLLITVKPVLDYSGPDILPFALIFPGIGFSVAFSIFCDKKSIITKMFALFWGITFGGIPWFYMVFPVLQMDNLYLLTYIIGLICIFIMIFAYKAMPKRTKYGNYMLGKIRGFKTFLETVEKQQLETMVMQNPTYFYDILPYTYVLGVSDKWVRKFESIALAAPNWYTGMSTFNVRTFSNFMNATMLSAKSVPSSSSSGGGGSGGGGSSGGGSGGGGGGSW